MDDLIKYFKDLNKGIDLSDILEEIENTEIMDNDMETEKLKSTYSKLKYLESLNQYVTLAYNKEYLMLLSNYLQKVDNLSKHFLQNIEWDVEDAMYTTGKRIQKKLEESIRIEANLIKKLNVCVKAYSMLMNIAEDTRNENLETQVDDDEFLETFKKFKK
jgi:hypothetical protein